VPFVGDAAGPVDRVKLKELRALTLDIKIKVRVGLKLAEHSTERKMFVRRRVLSREKQNLMLHEELMDPFRVLRVRLRQTEAPNLGTQRP